VKSYHSFFSCSPSNNNTLNVTQFTVPPVYLNKRFYIRIDKPNHYELYTAANQLLLAGKPGEWVKNADGFAMQINDIHAKVASQFSVTKLPEWEVMNQIRSHL